MELSIFLSTVNLLLPTVILSHATTILTRTIENVSSDFSDNSTSKTPYLTTNLPKSLQVSSSLKDISSIAKTAGTMTIVPRNIVVSSVYKDSSIAHTADITTVLPRSSEELSAYIDSSIANTADVSTSENVNLNTDSSQIDRRVASRGMSLLNQAIMREQQFHRACNAAKQTMRRFIERYKTAWTLQIPVSSMSVNTALLLLPSVKHYLQQSRTLSRAQRLGIIKTLLTRMKSPRVLPNTILTDKRSEEMTSTLGVLTQLNTLVGMTDTMLRLLPNTESVDVSKLNISDIRTAKTVLAAAHIILDQLENL